MNIEWLLDGDGDWNLYVDGKYCGFVLQRDSWGETYHTSASLKMIDMGTTNLEEAKAAAFALWTFNR